MEGAQRSGWRATVATLAIVLLASAVGFAATLASGAFDAPSIGVPDEILVRLAAGTIEAADLRLVALAGAAMLVQPMIVIGLLLAIETWAGPRGRSRKDRRLAWAVQIIFVTAAALLTVALSTLGIVSDTPWLAADPAVGRLAATLQAVLLFLLALAVADFLRYWVHRAQHAIPLLWRFHQVHHGPGDLDVLHNFTHPVEKLVNLMLITVPTAVLVGADASQLFLLGGFFAIQGQLLHMNVPLRYGPFAAIIADNRFHFVHHSRAPADFNANFAGVFPVFDRLFGTYRAPRGDALPATGLAEWDGRVGLSNYPLARRAGGRPRPLSPPAGSLSPPATH